MQNVLLNNNVEMPILGFGVFPAFSTTATP
jgi:hypothetical protein